jgi:hypothetical protein
VVDFVTEKASASEGGRYTGTPFPRSQADF